MRPVKAFREQAEACAVLGSPMYAGLLDRLADDLGIGGPTSAIVTGHEDDPGPSALALRLLGSVHRLVLERRAGELAAYYPSVGGTWEPDLGSAAFLALLEREPEAAREWLDRAPQTNEVGRSTALVGGLLHLSEDERLPVRLFEIGSSAGLNLLADRFCHIDEAGRTFGDADSPVRLDPAWQGESLVAWPELRIAERRGCDLMPLDTTTTEGRLALTAYVWPDQQHRHERLRGALAVAQRTPPDVRRERAEEFVEGIELVDGNTTVLWHSVMWQYLPAAEQERVSTRIEALGDAATPVAPFVHLRFEPLKRFPEESVSSSSYSPRGPVAVAASSAGPVRMPSR